MADIYATTVLQGVVPTLIRPQAFLLNTFFPTVVQSETEDIAWDVMAGKRRVSPFVSPLRAGKIVESLGRTTSTFKPAYVKDKRTIDPNKALKRAAGERIGGGGITPADRAQANLVVEMEDQANMLTRRLELMAADALQDGKLTVTGEGYDAVEVNFGRDAALTVTLTNPNRWGDANIKPSENISDWSMTMLQKSGAVATDIVFTNGSWKNFVAEDGIQKSIDILRGGDSRIELGLQVQHGAAFKGVWGNYRLWLYNDWYLDDNGTEQPMLPDHGVVISGPQLEGTRYFGAIRDDTAGYMAMEMYFKSWVENDPPIRQLMMQSAPLVVPTRVNASFYAQTR